MTFITEYISEQDLEKYALQAINQREYGGRSGTGKWTIDRERDIYIRPIRYSREQPIDTTYSYHWKGYVLRVEVRSHTLEGKRGGLLHANVELIRPLVPSGEGAIWLPPELEGQREQITNDFKEAYTAQKVTENVGSGVYTAYTVTFK